MSEQVLEKDDTVFEIHDTMALKSTLKWLTVGGL